MDSSSQQRWSHKSLERQTGPLVPLNAVGGLPFSDADFGNPRVILDEDDRREMQGILSAGVSLPLMGHGLSQPLELNPC